MQNLKLWNFSLLLTKRGWMRLLSVKTVFILVFWGALFLYSVYNFQQSNISICLGLIFTYLLVRKICRAHVYYRNKFGKSKLYRNLSSKHNGYKMVLEEIQINIVWRNKYQEQILFQNNIYVPKETNSSYKKYDNYLVCFNSHFSKAEVKLLKEYNDGCILAERVVTPTIILKLKGETLVLENDGDLEKLSPMYDNMYRVKQRISNCCKKQSDTVFELYDTKTKMCHVYKYNEKSRLMELKCDVQLSKWDYFLLSKTMF